GNDAVSARWERREAELGALPREVEQRLARPGWRFGHITARRLPDGGLCLETLLLDPSTGGGEVLSAPVPPGTTEFPSLTPRLPPCPPPGRPACRPPTGRSGRSATSSD